MADLKKLDRKRDFGSCHPPEDGCHFEQDGIKFGPDDIELTSKVEKAERAKRLADEAAEAKRLADEAPEHKQLDAQLNG